MFRDNANLNMRARELNEEIQNTLVKYEAYDSQAEPNLCLQKLRKRFDAYKEATDHAEYYDQAYTVALQQKQIWTLTHSFKNTSFRVLLRRK